MGTNVNDDDDDDVTNYWNLCFYSSTNIVFHLITAQILSVVLLLVLPSAASSDTQRHPMKSAHLPLIHI